VEDREEPKVINVNLEDDGSSKSLYQNFDLSFPYSQTADSRKSSRLPVSKVLDKYEKPKGYVKKGIPGKEVETFNNYEDYKPVSEVFGTYNQNSNDSVSHRPEGGNSRCLEVSNGQDELLPLRDHLDSNRS
jgi:hypothetical protein